MVDPFLGEIRIFAGNFAPNRWAYCDGQLLTISQNDALFSLVGTTYGGDGRSTFALPDFRGRLVACQGTGPGLTPRAWGQKIGVESVTLTPEQLPSHNHPFQGTTATGNHHSPAGKVPAVPSAGGVFYEAHATADQLRALPPGSVGQTGGNAPHTNMMPALALHYIIALTGTYPSRT
ncbi:phage tail protein [Acanthopleuribacter pedis]|uniref:Phage tail protein n=1 Tax=Acanthopleuribacter pedis TaxID=442870 RepID=A0A8J7QC60_9BACT|nr:tail fiber protein [Acanthopleuribacter pedis]MBO1322966.1 phage tail protein [Acanthopleuribacter pedis]